jgi:TPR repeat protein
MNLQTKEPLWKRCSNWLCGCIAIVIAIVYVGGFLFAIPYFNGGFASKRFVSLLLLGDTEANVGQAMIWPYYAYEYYKLTTLAEQGNAIAQYNLAVIYHEGHGVPQDYSEAVKWLRKSAEQGIAEAQVGLGKMYAGGLGVPEDYVQAYMWVHLAAAQNNQDAIKGQDIMEKYMTQQQIAEGQRLALEWMQQHPKK